MFFIEIKYTLILFKINLILKYNQYHEIYYVKYVNIVEDILFFNLLFI